jgi:hypothetical protein
MEWVFENKTKTDRQTERNVGTATAGLLPRVQVTFSCIENSYEIFLH